MVMIQFLMVKNNFSLNEVKPYQGNRIIKNTFIDAEEIFNKDMLRLNPTFKLNNKLKKIKA